MYWDRFKRVISNPLSKDALQDVLTVLKTKSLTIGEAEAVLEMASACLKSEIVRQSHIPDIKDVEVERNGRVIPGPFVRDYLSRGGRDAF